jgi:outer membrane receptor protein involved in Fe transport
MDQDLGQTQQSFLRGFKRWWDAAAIGPPAAVTGDLDFDYSRDESFEDLAVFGELTWHATGQLSLTGGLRYYDNSFSNDTFMALPLYAGVFDPETSSFDVDENGVLWKGNVSYKLDGDSSLVYATISEGYRRGGANAVPTSGTFAEDPGFLRFDSDEVTNYEVGVKGQYERFQYSAAVFYVDWQDVQINTATPNWGFFAAVNGGDASSKGLELEIDASLTDRFGINVGYAYVDAQLDEDALSPTGTVLGSDGNQLPGTPEHAVMAGAIYVMPAGADRSWVSRVNGYYQSSTQNAISDSPRFNAELDAFQLWNLSTGLTSVHWDAIVWAKNIFNEEGVTGLFTEAYMGTAPDIGYFGNGSKQFLSLPRTFGLTLTYRY